MNTRRSFIKLLTALPFVASLPVSVNEDTISKTVRIKRSIAEIEAETIIYHLRIDRVKQVIYYA